MKCPICPQINLVMSSRQGIEIDYCPECRGVWLDRGELDKIIERSVDTSSIPEAPQYAAPVENKYNTEPPRGYYDPKYAKQKKYKSFLSELFD